MSESKRHITIDDVKRIKYVEDPQISPDGQWIAYVVMNAQGMGKGYDRNLYLISTGGGDPIQLTRTGKDNMPRWSPDGTHLAFVSSRSEKPQIYILPMDHAGEARPLTSAKNGAVAPAWSPDGEHIAYLSGLNADERASEDDDDTPPVDELDAKHRKERQQEDEKNRWDPRPMERIPYRQGTAYMDDRHMQVFVVPTAEGLKDDDAKPRRLTDAETSYSPPVWSKSGRTIITSRSWNTEADNPYRYQNIYFIDFESGVERRYADDQYRYFAPVPSYDGDWLLAIRSVDSPLDAYSHLVLIPLAGGEAIDLTTGLDRQVDAFDWLENGKARIMVLTEGRMEAHELDPQTKTFSPLVTDKQSMWGFDVHKGGALAYVSRTTTRLDELFFCPADGGDPVQLTSVNSDFMDEIDVLETHEIRYKNPHGDEIQGWYILPPDYEDGQKAPLALNIHGGPHVMWTPDSRAMWHEWQVHAAEGYVVFYCNPRGSNGYGEAFQQALHSAWGEVAMTDIMAGVDWMIEQGFVDEESMALTGGSYGGYMTAWIIGQTGRFASAVTQRGVYNLSSFYGTSDIPFLISDEFDTEPWDNPEKLWEHSPLAYAHKVTTPTLIIHSENDFRVPIEQAEQLFAFIRRATDTPVKMLRYPREGHELSRSGEPLHRMSRLRAMVNWFNQYCQPEKLAAKDDEQDEDDAQGDE